MKNIFRTILNGNSLKNKKLLLAAVLSSVTINCDATLQKINNPERKVESFTGEKLNKLYWQNVSKYLETQRDFEKFKRISDECRDAVNELHFNPIPITNDMGDELVFELFPNLETQCLYSNNDFKIAGVNYEKMYKVDYREYLEDIETGDYKKTKYTGGILVPKEEYEEEEKRLAELGKDSYAFKKTMAQFIINVFWGDFKKLPNIEKEKLINLKEENNKEENNRTVKRVELVYCTFRWSDIDQFGEAHIPYGVDIMIGSCWDDNIRSQVESITIPETVRLVKDGAFVGLGFCRLMKFESVNVVFKNDIYLQDCKSLETVLVKVKNEKELADFEQRLREARLPEKVLVLPLTD